MKNPMLAWIHQVSHQVLDHTRKMVQRGHTHEQVESYLRGSRDHLLQAGPGPSSCQLLEDMLRAVRHARPDAEMVGLLAVLATASSTSLTDFHSFSLQAQQRVRLETREHARLGLCDIDQIKLGAQLALSSLQPMTLAAQERSLDHPQALRTLAKLAIDLAPA